MAIIWRETTHHALHQRALSDAAGADVALFGALFGASMTDESERESSATMKAVAWIIQFVAALGIFRSEVRAVLLGTSVSASIDTNLITFRDSYDARTSTPVLAAEHFLRMVNQLRRKPRAYSILT